MTATLPFCKALERAQQTDASDGVYGLGVEILR
jgi:hypothetical protein